MFFSSEIDLPKMGILEVNKSRPIPKLARDGNDENFTKKGVLEKKCRSPVKVASGPQTFPLRSHEGPNWTQDEFWEKCNFPLGEKMCHFPTGKWAQREHKIFLNHYCTWYMFYNQVKQIEIGIEKVIDFLGGHFSRRRRRNSAHHFFLK